MQPACSLLCAILATAVGAPAQGANDGWPTTGGDPGGQRYSSLQQINKANVKGLKTAWTYHTGAITWVIQPDGSRRPAENVKIAAFESTPVLFENLLYLATPLDQVLAIEPDTGRERWRHDPQISSRAITSRGVAVWKDTIAAKTCQARVFLGTLDARLIALDAKTGNPCASFGQGGEVNLRKDVDYRDGDFYGVNSPPAVVGNVVIVGSAIQDNSRVDIEKGVVRGYDCRTGKLLWSWDPLPWASQQKLRTGAGNAWSYISADPEHGLVYVPTGSASPDFYGGLRPGDDRDADSVVALEASTGKRLWGFQTTHHNLWDYDVASQPVLFTFRDSIPAIAITTKMGMVFVLNRLTGEPLYPVTERPVPQSDVPGEVSSPTQPFSSLPTLSPIDWPKNVLWGANAEDDKACRKLVSGLRYEGIYTPPSLKGTLLFPGNLGGVNWGSPAFDPTTGMLYADTNRYAFSIRLIEHPSKSLILGRWRREGALLGLIILLPLALVAVRKRSLAGGGLIVLVSIALAVFLHHGMNAVPVQTSEDSLLAAHFGKEGGPQAGTPYSMYREPLLAPDGLPCTPQPWGTVSALNLNTGQASWQTPLGSLLAGKQSGTLNLGGPIVTAGGLVFTAASSEPFLRAFDASNGSELWKTSLPVPAQSTPMTYEFKGKQYLVVSAGGHGWFGTPIGDSVIAYALP